MTGPYDDLPEGEGAVPDPEEGAEATEAATIGMACCATCSTPSAAATPRTSCRPRSSVAGFAEFLAVEAVLDKRWPETKIEPSLDRIADLVELLGDPQRGYPVVHLTGTNGKTSTARMVDALLSEIGLRTGRYTSPHLQSATERINIDNRPITPERYVEVYRDVAPFVDLVDARHEAPDPAEQVRGAHRDGVRRVRGRSGGGRDRRGRPRRAVGTRRTSPTAPSQ